MTVIPRGLAGGYTVTLPEEERTLHSRSYFLSRLPVMMGGRAAEEIIFGDVTTGAHDDLQKATQIVRDMVCRYGMSERVGPITFGRESSMVFLGRDIGEERNYSEDTAKMIDIEVKSILEESYQKARTTLLDHRDQLDLLARTLMDKETLEGEEVRKLLSLPPLEPHVNGQVP